MSGSRIGMAKGVAALPRAAEMIYSDSPRCYLNVLPPPPLPLFDTLNVHKHRGAELLSAIVSSHTAQSPGTCIPKYLPRRRPEQGSILKGHW
jgi:hypothetical protein